ncbi:UDP-glucose/GDP-mannose dehydrogenase family protein [candidate division FCPU426 bacterium]|nr:UDP-glucose/GDP-mannose dehydrogenase family protein [candidate division FCPU426 bacterium]
MKICVVGTGYVGLVTCACFADLGNEVIGVDNDTGKIEKLQKGIVPIYEPGLQELIDHNLDKRLTFTTDLKLGVEKSEFIFIAVGTPPLETGEADLAAVKQVAAGIGRNLNGHKIVVDKSTVPVGMGDLVASIIEEHSGGQHKVEVVSNPEFLREGSAVHDFLQPDRILIGTNDPVAAARVGELYEPLEAKIIATDLRSAEMIKYASNAFLATKITFINEIANVCEKVDADVSKVAFGMGLDARIGPAFLNAGAGYGGSCFPKDVSALIHKAEKEGYDFKILKAVVQANILQKKSMLARIKDLLGPLEGKQIAALGLSFKPNTDDLREAVALEVIKELQENGARVRAYDPAAGENARQLLVNVKLAENAYEAVAGAHCLVIFTEWNEFKEMDLERVKNLMKTPVIVDGRNILDPEKVKALGFSYRGVGRK